MNQVNERFVDRPKAYFNALLAQKLIEEFSKRNFDGYYYPTKDGAIKKVLELIPTNSVISCGGSATLRELGLRAALNHAVGKIHAQHDVINLIGKAAA